MRLKFDFHAGGGRGLRRRLEEEGVIEKGYADGLISEFTDHLEQEFAAAKDYKPDQADWFGGRWAGLNKPVDPETARRNVETAIPKKLFESLGRTLTTVPDEITTHRTLDRVLDAVDAYAGAPPKGAPASSAVDATAGRLFADIESALADHDRRRDS